MKHALTDSKSVWGVYRYAQSIEQQESLLPPDTWNLHEWLMATRQHAALFPPGVHKPFPGFIEESKVGRKD